MHVEFYMKITTKADALQGVWANHDGHAKENVTEQKVRLESSYIS